MYQVISQPNVDIPVFEVRSPDGVVKKLHRNPFFLLSFLDRDTDTGTGLVEDEENEEVPQTQIDLEDNRKTEEKTKKESGTTTEIDNNQSEEDDDDTVYGYVKSTYTHGEALDTVLQHDTRERHEERESERHIEGERVKDSTKEAEGEKERITELVREKRKPDTAGTFRDEEEAEDTVPTTVQDETEKKTTIG